MICKPISNIPRVPSDLYSNMEDKLELAPCPFPVCDGEDVGVFATHDPKGLDLSLWWQAKCKECGATGPSRKTVERAAEDWNER